MSTSVDLRSIYRSILYACTSTTLSARIFFFLFSSKEIFFTLYLHVRGVSPGGWPNLFIALLGNSHSIPLHAQSVHRTLAKKYKIVLLNQIVKVGQTCFEWIIITPSHLHPLSFVLARFYRLRSLSVNHLSSFNGSLLYPILTYSVAQHVHSSVNEAVSKLWEDIYKYLLFVHIDLFSAPSSFFKLSRKSKNFLRFHLEYLTISKTNINHFSLFFFFTSSKIMELLHSTLYQFLYLWPFFLSSILVVWISKFELQILWNKVWVQ